MLVTWIKLMAFISLCKIYTENFKAKISVWDFEARNGLAAFRSAFGTPSSARLWRLLPVLEAVVLQSRN